MVRKLDKKEILFEAIILGEPASKSNSRRIIRTKRSVKIIKSKKALDYLKYLEQQLSLLENVDIKNLLEGDLSIYVDVWYKTRRPDLDIELIKDGLQGWVYKNDRQVREQHSKWHKDSDRPRCLIRIVKYKNEESILNL